jgi:hypothetical protein
MMGLVLQHPPLASRFSVHDLQFSCASCGARGEHELLVVVDDAGEGGLSPAAMRLRSW